MEFTGSRSSAAQQFMDPLDIAAVRPDHEYAPIWALQLYIRDMTRMIQYSYQGNSDTRLFVCNT